MPGWLAYHFPEACQYSYLSSVQTYPVGLANKAKEATSWLTAQFPQIKGAGEALNNLHKEAWDTAFNAAAQEAKRHFKHCLKCDQWVCAHACFNETSQSCRACSGVQSASKASNGNQSALPVCPHCAKETEEGKFCSNCGKSTVLEIFCGNCGKKVESERRFKFCPHCGDSLEYLNDIFKDKKEPA